MSIVAGALVMTFLAIMELGIASTVPRAAPPDGVDNTGTGPANPLVLIEALYYDGYESREPDEAFRLMNVGMVPAAIGGWAVTDGVSTVRFPPGTTLAPGQAVWCTKQADAFVRQFGSLPDFEAGDSDAAVPELAGTWPGFANHGDECLLLAEGDQIVDVLVYGDGNVSILGWEGPAVDPWTPSTSFAREGQILYRKRDQATRLPVTETDTAADWAQDPGDQVDGRKVLYPGWDLDPFFFTRQVTQTATLTVTVAPDNLFATLASLLAGAQKSIEIEGYSFRSRELAGVLLDRLKDGVRVTLLLEGAPAFEGVTNQEKWIVRKLYDGGARILFMINDDERAVHDRYRNQHAKLMIVDEDIALVGSENLTYTGMPADDKANGTAGRRGVYVITDAPGVVERMRAVFIADADPDNHVDVVGCDQVPELCTPPPGFEPELTPDWITYTIQFPTPQTWRGAFAFEVVQSPENSLRTRDGLLGLINRAGSGDTLLIEQLHEPVHWGPSHGTPETDPNLRLAAYLDAARRGASVRILLDSHLDQGGENRATTGYLQSIARAENLDLQVRQGNPASLGLHNKMVLAKISGRGFVHAGSINGNEVSSKVNRELALQVQSDEAYDYLKAVFDHDWRSATLNTHLPLVVRGFWVPQAADHLLVSEVYYGTIPQKEWVEIYNPTGRTVDLTTHKIGDAVHTKDFEGTYRFPPGATISPGQVLVLAVTATGFWEDFSRAVPDYEMLDTDPSVPDLHKYTTWGRGDWGLSNDGDEVVLLDGNDHPVDVVVYGDGSHHGVIPHPGVVYGHSLERVPVWLDTDDCITDFRDWPYPSPGSLPW